MSAFTAAALFALAPLGAASFAALPAPAFFNNLTDGGPVAYYDNRYAGGPIPFFDNAFSVRPGIDLKLDALDRFGLPPYVDVIRYGTGGSTPVEPPQSTPIAPPKPIGF